MNIISHRGAGSLAPENTIRSIKHAVDLGAKLIEFDIQATKDHQLVLMHDSSLYRTSGDLRLVKDVTLEEIKRLKNREGDNIPTLSDASEVFKSTKAVIEGKGEKWAKPLMKQLDEFEITPIIISYNLKELCSIRDQNKSIELFLINKTNPFTAIHEASKNSLTGVTLLYWMYNPFVYLYAKHKHLKMSAFTVRPNLTKIFHWLYPDVTITTDRPDLFTHLCDTTKASASTKR